MSWMDSWSRPGKVESVPPPFYLTNPDTKYCHTCGRIISERRSHKSAAAGTTPAKYCSSRCRGHKPKDQDRKIEDMFRSLLNGEKHLDGNEMFQAALQPRGKGDRRLLVPCSIVEALIYGDRADPTKVYGRRKNRHSRVIEEAEEGTGGSYPEEMGPTAFAGKVRLPQHMNTFNGSIGGEKGRAERVAESEESAQRRFDGQRIAEEKETVKRAARRLCVFGVIDEDETRMCEAVMAGKVVEPSFAKGDWGVRWRE